MDELYPILNLQIVYVIRNYFCQYVVESYSTINTEIYSFFQVEFETNMLPG